MPDSARQGEEEELAAILRLNSAENTPAWVPNRGHAFFIEML
jgi:hypothetical protein